MADPMGELVVSIIREATRRAGTQDALAARMNEATDCSYNGGNVSSWVRRQDRAMPGADALLTAAKVTEISLDALLFPQGPPTVKERLDALENRVAALERSDNERLETAAETAKAVTANLRALNERTRPSE